MCQSKIVNPNIKACSLLVLPGESSFPPASHQTSRAYSVYNSASRVSSQGRLQALQSTYSITASVAIKFRSHKSRSFVANVAMGKKQHSKDRMFITTTEWATEWGGAKYKDHRTPFKRLPFYCCAYVR